MDLCPYTGSSVIKKEFRAMYPEDHHARSGRAVGPLNIQHLKTGSIGLKKVSDDCLGCM